MIMWIKSYSKVYPDIKKETIWQLWSDINNYTQWHDDLEYCTLKGDFIVGNYFMLKPKNSPVVKVVITELIKYKKFADCTTFFGAKMYDIHELEETAEGLRITSTIKVTGILSFLWVKLVAQQVARAAATEMEALVRLASNTHA